MPDVQPIAAEVKTGGVILGFIVKWPQMTQGQNGVPYAAPGWADRNVQVLGTAGAGFHCRMQGANSGAPGNGPSNTVYPAAGDWSSLHSGGLTFDVSSPGDKGIAPLDEAPLWVRPVLSGGDGTTLVDVYMMVRVT